MTAAEYIASIRNRNKQTYAVAYWRFLRTLAAGGPPAATAVEPERGELSYMAGQAVRINLREYLNRET